MNVPRVLSILFLLVVLCSPARTLKNDRGGPSKFGPGTNFVRRRRIALNEFLVPPPLPRPHPVRTGRVANPQPPDSPGYFSKFMNWLNPFGYGSPPSSPSKSPPFLPTPQSHPPFNLHHSASQPGSSLQPPPGLQPGPPLYPSPGPQPNLPLYPPLGPSLGPHPGSVLPPHPEHPVLPRDHPSASVPIFNPPPPTLHGARHFPSVPKKQCNPCNKYPWIPMQDSGHHSGAYPPPPQHPNGYLPPPNQDHHDVQHAASHQVRIPDFSHVQIHQNSQQGATGPSSDPHLFSGPMPPLYKAQPFDRPPQNPYTENVGNLEPPPVPAIPPSGQGPPEINGEHFNNRDNHDSRPSGTQLSQGHASVTAQNHGNENKELNGHKESFGTGIFDNRAPISGPSEGQGYHNPSGPQQEHGILDQRGSQNTITSFGASDFGNHGFTSQNGVGYHGPNGDFNYLPPNLNLSTGFGASAFDDQGSKSLNYQYSDDLSPSSSVVKDSHATTQTTFASSPSTDKSSIHFEESPLLDLTKKGDSHTNDKQWPSSTVTYDDVAKTTANYNLQPGNSFIEDSSSFTKPIEAYSSLNKQNGDFGTSTPATVDYSGNDDRQYSETSTITSGYTNHQDVSYIPPSGQAGFLWPSLLLNAPSTRNETFENNASLDPLARWHNTSKEAKNPEQQGRPDSKDFVQRPQNVKRNKQVQVIIPYTSEYTPIPFQQSYGDWSVKNNLERSQPRKVPPSHDASIDNYVQQESRNEIRLINHLQSQFNFSDSNKSNTKPPSIANDNDARPTATRANNSIDVRRLQKNIDNWTIQEYSKFPTSSTVLPSSSHPYLLPSKKIPTEYLTTTEPGYHRNESNDKSESVKSYSLAGFSFNEVEHEGSASNHIEETRVPLKVVRIESSKSTSSISDSVNKTTTNGLSTWDGYTVSISPVNKERVYVVTPQPVTLTSSKSRHEKSKGEGDLKNSHNTSETSTEDAGKSEDGFSEFEAIEKAYQVLPQAVNNLAVASTGKEDVPLWGIMEHEAFAALNVDDTGEESTGDVLDGPVLYSGHSKVSRAKR
ncbi:uncharacterized protein LOC128873302 [Hylaeus volcanicus]|uniref:uncharacterized protein LOC128873302 n=1 Tax=Hylaeus volcanicus TaxID=313075 RepID=UPI0023B7C384|nr:uncharacterized protein LOC128873302 [Hylaeus volcanicus]